MANRVCDVLLTTRELVRESATDARWGAVAEFRGIVRGLEDGREISGIEYEAHEAMAEHQLKQIAEAARQNFSLGAVLLHHRIGFVPVGEPSLLVRVASSHRAAAFNALSWMVDELKKRVPIWKQPRFRTNASSRDDRTNGSTASADLSTARQ